MEPDLDGRPSCLPNLELEIVSTPTSDPAPVAPQHTPSDQSPFDAIVPEESGIQALGSSADDAPEGKVVEASEPSAEPDGHAEPAIPSALPHIVVDNSGSSVPEASDMELPPEEPVSRSVTSDWSTPSGDSSAPSGASGTTVKPPPQPFLHRSRSWPGSRSDLSGSFQKLVIEHLEQDTGPPVSQASDVASPTTLAELAHLVRLETHLFQKHRRLQTRVHRCIISSALSSRLLRSGALAQRSLVDYYKQDDKRGFATLYNALHDVRNSCDSGRRYAFVEPNLDIRIPGLGGNEMDSLAASFLDQVPLRMKDDLLHFISKVRTEPSFLANRLISLSPVELVALASSSHALDPLDSVMSSQQYMRPQGPTRRTFSISPSPLERLLSFQRRDPLPVLLYTIFAESGGPQAEEDLRRTEVWSTACARLISERTAGNEQFMRAVFNAWASLRDWPCKANLELYLMRMLQDGAFILDWAAKRKFEPLSLSAAGGSHDTTAMERFYDQAIKDLFALLVDQPNSCSMPLGIYEIGNAIMRKLATPERQQAARTLVVCKWFFSSFLLDAMIYPEAHGMMAGYHISASARQRILKEIAVRAQRHVWDVSFNWKPLKPVPLEVRRDIELILAGISNSPVSSQKPPSHSARSIPSPPETFEVRPFLVLCPSDIITLVNGLFPEPRPSSSYTTNSSQQHSFRSTSSSASESSIPGHTNTGPSTGPSRVADTSSSISNSGSSVTSETVSQDPSLDRFGQRPDGMSSHTSVGSRDTLLETHRTDSIESYGHCLRSHAAQLSAYLGHHASSGALHPCAEAWAVVYISSDGQSLETLAPNDIGEDEEETLEEAFPTASGGDARHQAGIDLEGDYRELKATVRHLLEEYDVPEEVPRDGHSKSFSNRFSTFLPHDISDQPGIANINSRGDTRSSSQERHHVLPTPAVQKRSSFPPENADVGADPDGPTEASHPSGHVAESQLLAMLEAAVEDCRTRLDFAGAHSYWEALHQLRTMSSSTMARDHFRPLLTYFARGPRNALRKLATEIEDHDAWLLWLQRAHERRDALVTDMITSAHRLRTKMWYATDVRNSAEYEDARNVAVALRHMGETPKSSRNKSSFPFLPRNLARAPTNSLVLKTEAQVLSLLSASPEQGGASKLSDDQSEMTQQWLRQRNVVNFCKGEERIHRFCLEIDRCINRLIGYDITAAPVLWSSDLFSRDKLVLESGHQPGGLRVTNFGTLVPAGPPASQVGARPSIPRSTDWSHRPLPSSVRSENFLQQSFDPGHGRLGAGRQLVDNVTPYRQLPAGSLSSNAGVPETFWSPFIEQRPSSAKQATRTWPRALAERSAAAGKGLGGTSVEKDGFLRDLKQDLTGLLLSDLGSIWGRGSETDVWFSSGIGEDFLRRLEGDTHRVPAQVGDVSGNVEHETGPSRSAASQTQSEVLPVAASQPNTMPPLQPTEEASQETRSSETSAEPPATVAPAQAGGFPYDSAFQRLLQLFSIHPNPFTKLQALHQLVLLIALSVDKRSRSHDANDLGNLPEPGPSSTTQQHPGASPSNANGRSSQARGPTDVIARCEQRRSQTGRRRRLPSPWRRRATAPSSSDVIADGQEIVARLQRLFRDSQTRPRALFRDFQFMAAFVPGQVLDESDGRGAFWNASLAALGLKQDVCRMMVEMADRIVGHHTKTRPVPPNNPAQSQAQSQAPAPAPAQAPASAPASASVEPSERGPLAEVSRFSMADAARMLTIPAKEGDPVAQRELAIFYLTHPDLVARTIFPLSRPREIFKSQMMNARDEDPARSDPATMCVAYHWMELSSQGGDELARQYLRAREELNALP